MQFWRKLATTAAVAVTGFLCGWSALGLTDGTVLAVALCAGVAVPLFRGQEEPCPLRHRESRQRAKTGAPGPRRTGRH